ncbi:MAG: type III PLP-dependent enzyme [Alphaproteobacteria bacterium]|nr:type III PLP-dependent enzyme [Alphaproteobacteria bacterium]
MIAAGQGRAQRARKPRLASVNPDPTSRAEAPSEIQAAKTAAENPKPSPNASAQPAPAVPAVKSKRRSYLSLVKPVRPRRDLVPQGEVSPRQIAWLAQYRHSEPVLVVDLELVEQAYVRMARALPAIRIYYAVKANPAPEIIRLLSRLGAYFDTASPIEIGQVMAQGVSPERISYGNTIKKQADIQHAFTLGVRDFAFDSEAELRKLAAAAPGARAHVRVLMDSAGAEWPLSRKFGCSYAMAEDLMLKAKAAGLDPAGICFHVGSQQTDLTRWPAAIADMAGLIRRLAERGIAVRVLNLGGGFPSRYRKDVPSIDAYAQAIHDAVKREFGDKAPQIVVEPGRAIVGDAGVVQSEVVLVSRKDATDDKRWVYLDIGKFSGLAETMDEAIKYRLRTDKDGGPLGAVCLAGPSCDSADILYEKADVQMPLDLAEGDKVLILSTGAYTTTYSSVGFNGFPPLKTVCI